jgi:Leucine-rich repeat (LRR) protein
MQIVDISPLAGLINMEELELNRNQISDISHLKNLTNLTNLDLHDNKISDISDISSLTKLRRLRISHNQVSDISHLENLTELRYLNIHENEISDISVLFSLTKLERLELYNNKINISQINALQSALPRCMIIHRIFCENCQTEGCDGVCKPCKICGEIDCDGECGYCGICESFYCQIDHIIAVCTTCGVINCEIHYKKGDVDGNGVIDMKDATQIIMFVAGLNGVIKLGGKDSCAWEAALITQDSINKNKPQLSDAVKIIMRIASSRN